MPAPKHSAEKVRRSRPPVPPLKLPLHHNGKVPPMPKTFTWTAHGKAYWKTIWTSPMALIFIDADVPALTRMTFLHEVVATEERGPQLLAELRQLEDRFGMSPLSRRRLQFDIDRAANQALPEAERKPEEDSRWLRIVDSA